MAKDKKGGKKGGKKKAEPEETDTMTEVEKELFQIQINDLQQKVERHVYYLRIRVDVNLQ